MNRERNKKKEFPRLVIQKCSADLNGEIYFKNPENVQDIFPRDAAVTTTLQLKQRK